jgi:putative sterol carrier protein
MGGARESIRYCVVVSKKEEIVEGPEDATVTVTVSLADAAAIDPTTAFMLGRLKTNGSTGALFRGLRTGEVATTLRRIVQDHANRGNQ